jgi:hypothetical protein
MKLVESEESGGEDDDDFADDSEADEESESASGDYSNEAEGEVEGEIEGGNVVEEPASGSEDRAPQVPSPSISPSSITFPFSLFTLRPPPPLSHSSTLARPLSFEYFSVC